MNITILERHTTSGIGSLSGVACIGNDIYFVADDVRYLLKTNLNKQINNQTVFEKIPLFEQSKNDPLVPLSKAEKPDFESLSTIEFNGVEQLLLMGSGSKNNRKYALLYNPNPTLDPNSNCDQIKILFNALDYHFLENNLDLTGGADLNIEAICSDNQNLYIFQRGNINRHHGVLVFDLAHIQDGKPLQQTLTHAFSLQLPDLDGFASGISDAYFLKQQSLIFAIASVEQTSNTYDDGQILGSFMILLSPAGETLDSQLIKNNQGQPLPIKVEGIVWLESTIDGEVFLLVTDSDGGDSEILRVLVTLDDTQTKCKLNQNFK
jgi:hypothetical protein